MGGRGSGRYGGYRAATCEDYHAIDLAWLRRKGVLKRLTWSRITWSRGGERVASIGVRSEGDGLRLRYRARSRQSDKWAEFNEFIPFTYTDTNFGGRRPWFECPSCGRRCRVLYGGKRYRCRNCHRLKYKSQYETGWRRAESRACRISERLGGTGVIDDPLPAKPKGMHWATYVRLFQRHEALTGEFVEGFHARIEEFAARARR